MLIKLFGGPSDGQSHFDRALPVNIYCYEKQPHRLCFYREDAAPLTDPPPAILRYDVLPFHEIGRALDIGVAVFGSEMVKPDSIPYRRAVRWIRSRAWSEINAICVEKAALTARFDVLLDALRKSDPDNRPDLRPAESLRAA